MQADSIRIGNLRAFSDRQTVMIEFDERERLRVRCIQHFALPMSERLLLQTKCSYRRDGGRVENMRLILLTNYVILDPAFYGPNLDAAAVCFAAYQVPVEHTTPSALTPEPLHRRSAGASEWGCAPWRRVPLAFRTSSPERGGWWVGGAACVGARIRVYVWVRPPVCLCV